MAERLLRLLAGYADEKVMDWDAEHPTEKFLVMPDPHHFVEELTQDLNRVYGLDPEQPNYRNALEALAGDLFRWASRWQEDAWKLHHLTVDGQRMFVEARPYPPLVGIKHGSELLSNWDSSELRRRLYDR